jgi:hypothetical protein
MAKYKKKKKAPIPVSDKNLGGRPGDYRIEFNDMVRKLCLLGATDEEIAGIINISISTLNLWKLEHPKFSESMQEGKSQADSNVAERLYQRAMGFEAPETITATNQGVITDMKTITKHHPPDTQAIKFWLTNRQSKKWRDKTEVEQTGNPTINIYQDIQNRLKEKSNANKG